MLKEKEPLQRIWEGEFLKFSSTMVKVQKVIPEHPRWVFARTFRMKSYLTKTCPGYPRAKNRYPNLRFANLGAELGNTDKFIGCATSILSRLTDCMKILVTTFWNCFKTTNPLDFLNYPPRWKMPRIFPAEKFSVPAENFGNLPAELSHEGVCSAGCNGKLIQNEFVD